jgi:iron(III) transport system substrate-binding protein
MNMLRRLLLATAAAAAIAMPAQAESVVNIYSYRQPALIEPLLEAFTRQTGIQTRIVFADAGLVERLAQEGANSPADILLSVDVTRLVEAAEKGLAQPVEDAAINAAIPANLRDAQNNWFGLTLRARVAYVSKERVKNENLTYEELAGPEFKGRVCLRPGQHVYNLGLISAMIAHRGEAATKEWLSGLKANLAIKPAGNDRAQAKSVFAGECDVAIANTYYMGKMMTNTEEPEQQKWAEAVRIVFPSSKEMPTHVNISGMMLTKSAPNKADALKLMQFLASPQAQQIYAEANFEYPVNPATAPSDIVKAWGSFTPDPMPVAELTKHLARASELVDEVRFDE